MSNRTPFKIDRRSFLRSSAALACASAAPAWAQDSTDPFAEEEPEVVTRNIAGFRAHRWQPHFDSLKGGAILVDTKARSLHYWSEDQSVFKIYPTSVPLSAEMTRLGRTSVTQKVEGPSWAPTPSMIKRNPEWPPFVPPGPDNPLGTHALYLSWKYYRIHGTHDVRKIGRQSSNGCIGLYNEDIQELFSFAKVGTQVLLI
ncbi:L,D-transpeptidase [Meridianimarinicoccus aquatilis]|uniref:L,D-transpeptidase n=1 Tax=Meridianimarinicoccus aquatilis TaxID=2552766 RepID=A0A4R6AUF1_9RHOB|nr:L,D-transpeptidase [Fluviibacterium aquatile]QIE40799.1 L,D-transpeptidase [Rhodobacteraceae bacterium SC52]TDL85846.1 L,D-transpeptidase [Fluviibacterium aquatile]